jgi:hypothetical protein
VLASKKLVLLTLFGDKFVTTVSGRKSYMASKKPTKSPFMLSFSKRTFIIKFQPLMAENENTCKNTFYGHLHEA